MAGPAVVTHDRAAATSPAWSIVPSPDQRVTAADALNGVSCVSASACTAVGFSVNAGGVDQTLAESWNGTAWSIVPSPDQGTTNNVLNGVSCVSASSCTAVGYSVNAGDLDQTLVESWNGTAWSMVPSPSGGALDGVFCLSASSCTAVGHGYNRFTEQTLVESWNGTAWSIVPSPDKTLTTHNGLNGVSCLSASSCTAAGYYVNAVGAYQTLAESWNGTAWSMVRSPSGGALTGVSCISARSCTAVGWNGGTVVESWNGTAWSIVPSPNRGPDGFSSVSCVSAGSCTAAGNYVNASGVYQTLVESWNGTAWSIVPSPDDGTGYNSLSGVSCVSASACTAVGNSVNASGVDQTLVERYA
jgi:hypothetical protein